MIWTYSHPGSDPGGVLGTGDEASSQGRLSPVLSLSAAPRGFHARGKIESIELSVSPSRFDGTAKECSNIVVTVMQGRVDPRGVDAADACHYLIVTVITHNYVLSAVT